MKLQEIELMVKTYAGRVKILLERSDRMKNEIEAVEKRLMPGIENAAMAVADCRKAVLEAIEENRHLFVKPKTQVMHGIRCGMMKQKGTLEISDPAAVIDRIKTLYPDRAPDLINCTEKPDKKGLEKLDAKSLRRLGVGLTDDVDVPFLKEQDTSADKIVKALIANCEKEAAKSSS